VAASALSTALHSVLVWCVALSDSQCPADGAVLPVSAAPVGRGADGVDAMA
jgi:hypothetical protein